MPSVMQPVLGAARLSSLLGGLGAGDAHVSTCTSKPLVESKVIFQPHQESEPSGSRLVQASAGIAW